MADLFSDAVKVITDAQTRSLELLGAAWVNKFGTVPRAVLSGSQIPRRIYLEEDVPPHAAKDNTVAMAFAKTYDRHDWWVSEPENAVIQIRLEDLKVYVEIVREVRPKFGSNVGIRP